MVLDVGMRMVHFRVGEVVEATKKEDFILAEEHDSASDTCEEDRAETTFESLVGMDCFGSPALSVESSWQVGSCPATNESRGWLEFGIFLAETSTHLCVTGCRWVDFDI